MQKWVTVDESYLDSLREVDSRVPFSNYGEDKFKPFFGTLFEKDNIVYVAAISHAQPRHSEMKNAPDFVKVYIHDNKSESGEKLAAVVNLRYMIPVPKNMLQFLKYSDVDKHRTFQSERDKSVYIDLMEKELEAINSMNIEKKAQRLYSLKLNYPDNIISKRCLEFLELEAVAAGLFKSEF